jgi:TatD DNase family protein
VAYFDTHCHLNHELFAQDIDDVLVRAKQSNVKYILVPGWNVESSRKAVELAEKYPQIIAAVGIHPTDWQMGDQNSVKEIEELALHSRVAAIGEIGLDFHHDPEHKEEQSELLIKMLAIAKKAKKPVLIHSRESVEILIGLLSKAGNQYCGVIHAFEGNLSQAKALIDLGFLLGAGGALTYKNSMIKKEVFSQVPDETILLETDAPYLPPVPHRGERNEPAYMTLTADYLCSLREKSSQLLLNQIYQNGYKMFLQDIAH